MLSPGKLQRMQSISDQRGVIAALAMDQRRSLRTMMAAAAGRHSSDIGDELLVEFKTAVSRVLSPHVSSILLDTEFGADAMRQRCKDCGLLVTYEADGYDNPRPNRMLALMPYLSVSRIREFGGEAVKILLSWAPDDTESANEEKRTMIERIGWECEALELPFFLEPVVYDPQGSDPKSVEWARRKPNMVVRTMEEFSKPVYRVDVLKVEFPVSAAFTRGAGPWSKAEAMEWYRAADSVARVPYIYLSAGVSSSDFLESLLLAAEAGVRFSGVLCGRATWQDSLLIYMKSGAVALHAWLGSEGVRNVQAINECLRAAVPWHSWHRQVTV
jgi:tagatose 1,6-diphosphate aldolase